MNDFLGIVVDRSLKNQDFINRLDVVTRRQGRSWGMLLVSVPEDELQARIELLQHNMIAVQEDCWYAHFFRDNDLIIVYQDRVFRTSLSPETWTEAIQYGLDNGIPIEQLDFKPRTRTDAASYFGVNQI